MGEGEDCEILLKGGRAQGKLREGKLLGVREMLSGRLRRAHSESLRNSLMMVGFIFSTSLRGGRAASSSRTCAASVASGQQKVVSGGPSWVISTEYPSLESDEIASDMKKVRELIEQVKGVESNIRENLENSANMTVFDCRERGVLDALSKSAILVQDSSKLLQNIAVYANCEKSVDGLNSVARKLSLEVMQVAATLREATVSKNLFLMQCGEDVVQEYLASSPATQAEKTGVRRSRLLRDTRLSAEEEKLLTSLNVHGHSSWGTLYTTLSSTIKAEVLLEDGTKDTVGMATATALLDSSSEEVRKAAWEGIRDAWAGHAETCAAALNAMVGWRLDLYKRRGMHFLDTPLYQNHMTSKTLEAMLKTVEERSEMARNVLKMKARLLGKEKLDAWDLFAPLPEDLVSDSCTESRYTYEEAIDLIKESVGKIHPQMGEFVQHMKDSGWIEARTADTKVPGAYQTAFAKSRTPRVYMSNFNGGATHVLTLAHELGHAFHYWTMRELPLPETSLGMNVAETASIFFETVVSGALLERSTDSIERLKILWTACENVTAFLLNIPARYRFEEELHIRREKNALSPQEMDEIMESAWNHQYKDSLATVQSFFWQSKLHFYITGVCFYNFPYTFGWLLALGVYGQRERLGDDFFDRYTSLLKDSGKLDAEELVSTHLEEDISDEAFWNRSLDAAEEICNLFIKEAAALKPIPGDVYEA